MNTSTQEPPMTQFGVTGYVKDVACSFVTEHVVTTAQKITIPGFSVVKKEFYDRDLGTVIDSITVQSHEYYIICDMN